MKMPLFGFLESLGASAGFMYLFLGIGMAFMTFKILDIETGRTLGYIFKTAPIWFPPVSIWLFYKYWMMFVRMQFDLSQGRVTLEIKLPQDIYKSPEAMEQVLIQLHQVATPDNLVQTYWDGKKPPVYGLEIVSRGGDLRFYISAPRRKMKNIVEAQLYAQYPGIEVNELAIDYTAEIPWKPDTYSYFSIHFGPKRNQAYPIKTYYEYGLHTMPKEEEKTDPISSMLEALANIGPNEWYWVQILIDAHRSVDYTVGYVIPQPDWREGCKKEIQNIIDGAVKRAGAEPGGNVMMLLTDGEKDTLSAIERSMGKNAYNVGFRCMYIAAQETFNPGERIGQLITAWRAFDDLNRNQIGVRWRTDYDYNWWQDPFGHRKMYHKRRELYEYKTRYYENQGSADKQKVFTTEELATMYHLPGRVALTPTLGRIPSRRSEAPPNLPT